MEEQFNEIVEKIMNGEKALSYSSLRQFLESPRHFKKYIMSKDVTPAMIEGKLFHLICLEPDKFNEKYYILNDTEIYNELIKIGNKSPRSTKVYKTWKEQEILKNSGKEIVDVELYNKLFAMRETLIHNPSTKPYLLNLDKKEAVFEFTHDNFKIKGFKDGIGNFDGKYTLDLKKVSDSKFKRVKYKILDDHLDMQAGIYCYDENNYNYHLIFIDNECNVTRVKLLEETISTGFEKFEMTLREFSRCAEENLWNCSYDFWNGGFINF